MDSSGATALARRYARLLDVPDDVTRWTDDDVVLANVRDVIDPPGNWILGERLPPGDGELPIAPAARAQIYSDRAERCSARTSPPDHPPAESSRSSPRWSNAAKDHVHVLVKFSRLRGASHRRPLVRSARSANIIAADVLMGTGGIPTPRTADRRSRTPCVAWRSNVSIAKDWRVDTEPLRSWQSLHRWAVPPTTGRTHGSVPARPASCRRTSCRMRGARRCVRRSHRQHRPSSGQPRAADRRRSAVSTGARVRHAADVDAADGAWRVAAGSLARRRR